MTSDPSIEPAPVHPVSSPTPKRKRALNPLWIVLSLSAFFFLFFLVFASLIYMGANSDREKAGVAGKFFDQAGVGLIELNGVILDSKRFIKGFEALEENKRVKSIVVRLNSPGGAVGPSQEIYDAVRRSKKPVIASMGSVAASGAFYVAMGAQKVFSNPGTLTGSIGVIMQFMNLSKLYEWAKVQRYSIKTGKFKDSGADYKEMDEESRVLLQALVDDTLVQFKTAVALGRKLPMEKVTAVADGRIFTGAQAKALGLVDQLGGLHEAIEEAAKIAKIDGKPKIITTEKKRRNRALEFLLDDDSDERGESESDSRSGVGAMARIGSRLEQLLERIASGGANSPSEGMTPGLYWIWSGAR